MSELNAKQSMAMQLLRANPTRELYEGAGSAGSRGGSGYFWITYTADISYSPLTWPEVRDLERRGLISEKWPGCYELAAGAEPGQPTGSAG